MPHAPTRDDVLRIVIELFGEPPRTCERFPTGLRNWVYDVTLSTGRRVVVRMSLAERREEVRAAVRWSDLLSEAGVPVANVLHADVHAPHPYLLLERLPGTDLGNQFEAHTKAELDGIADEVVSWQRAAADSLPPAAGFGFALSYDDVLATTWGEALVKQLDRSEAALHSAGIVDPAIVEPVRRRLRQCTSSLDAVEPAAFLHDATTKNVIVHQGEAIGLVDVDVMAFGDPLYLAALTRASLLAARRSPAYAERLAAQLGDDTVLLDLYTVVHCVGFLSELGHAFNQHEPAPVQADFRHHLEAIVQSLL